MNSSSKSFIWSAKTKANFGSNFFNLLLSLDRFFLSPFSEKSKVDNAHLKVLLKTANSLANCCITGNRFWLLWVKIVSIVPYLIKKKCFHYISTYKLFSTQFINTSLDWKSFGTLALILTGISCIMLSSFDSNSLVKLLC